MDIKIIPRKLKGRLDALPSKSHAHRVLIAQKLARMQNGEEMCIRDRLIGIVVAKSSGSDVEGLGFAIPINKAADVAQQILENGYVSGQPSTGMSYTESSGQSSTMDRLFNNGQSTTYVYIAAVDGTNAQKAGFQKGDMVYAVDGTEITSFNTLSSIVTSHSVGDKLKFTIVRNGQKMDLTLTLEEKTS